MVSLQTIRRRQQEGRIAHRRDEVLLSASDKTQGTNMQLGPWRTIVGGMGTMVVCLLSVTSAGGQALQEQTPPLAEEVHKNVQVLRGIPETQFMETMGFFSASLGANCTYCHVAESSGSWDRYADDNEHKQTARGMIRMMNAIN